MAERDNGFDPKIVAFFCNWCTYLAADSAGVSRKQYPPNIRIIRSMCSGRVDPVFVLEALSKGADGVLIGGCHPGDCHYIRGNLFTRRRVMMLKKMLDTMGIEPARLRLEWVSASEGQKLANVVDDFVKEIEELGPSPLRRSRE